MKVWQIFSIITLFVASIGLLATASHAGEIADLEKRLKFLKSQKEIIKKLDDMQSNIDSFQKQLNDFRVKYDLKESPSKPALQKQTQSANKDGDFESLMVSLSKKKHLFSGLTTNSYWSFKKISSDGKWSVKNLNNGFGSEVISLGKNKIGMETFPDGWTINGIFVVTISSSGCKLTQERDKSIVLEWNCG